MPDYPMRGGCACGAVRYEVRSPPLFVHCCHCTDCQRETGAAFAWNAPIESERVTLALGEPVLVDTPTSSGGTQRIARCPRCFTALWSHYGGAGPVTMYLRVATLDDPGRWPPRAHIHVRSAQSWLSVVGAAVGEVPQFRAHYDAQRVWPEESLARWRALGPQIEAWRAGRG